MAKGKNDVLVALQAFWDSLTDEQREELVRNLDEINALIGSLKGKGVIEYDERLGEITIIKKTPDISRLRELLDLTGIKSLKIVNKRG
jgi:hypothetical protein